MSFPLSRKPVSIAALLVLGAGLALTGVMTVWLAGADARRNQQSFEHAADISQAAFRHEFDEAINGLAIVNRRIAGNDAISRRHFHGLAMQLVEMHPYIQAFSYARVVPGDQRRAFEAKLREEHGNIVVTEMRDGVAVPAGERPHYLVIDDIAPEPSNRKAVGLDISTIPGKEAALERARTTGQPSATGLFAFPPEVPGKHSFAVLMPVYRSGTAARDDAVTGYTTVVLHAPTFVESVLRHAALLHREQTGLGIYIDDGKRTELVYRTGGGEDDRILDDPEIATADGKIGIVREVNAAGLRWLVVSSRAPVSVMSGSAWVALGAGTSISILFALYLQSLAVQASYLTRTNARLRRNIDSRKRIEHALRASEERFESLARMSSDWYWEQDAEFRFTKISSNAVFGSVPTSELIGKTRSEMPLEIDPGEFDEHLQVLKAHVSFTDLEYHVRDRNGKVHWMSVSGEPLFAPDGTFLGYRGTGKDITARKETEQALRQSQTELRDLAAHQARVKEDERKRIAREIHDDLGQNLLALRIDVLLLEGEIRKRLPEVNDRVHGLLSHVDNVVRSMRAIINDLRPPVLDLGLQCAFEWQVQQFRQRSGIACTLDLEDGNVDSVLDEEAATSLFRILQESLTNVSRHSQARHVDIRLHRSFGSLVLEISDDGVGGQSNDMRKPRSFGLIGIRERVYSLGGEFRVASTPGNGTTLTIMIPATATSAAAA
ncbi:CHASE domain-containing protein [Noviherbaspirillum denitrificans]|uniref:Histidine kinase n=1 Tax=Noviherbaspirillum denitrificans TaxID=1968433 RepID=A0A254T7M9_9BURK|nr:CHASE domain-containing protein [Noviherbaspirillum denitrificans]OWW18656.1 hypothetical protein AYR66_03505 [Noviherbaspirillum denitrificans]